jgi:hypothetical protein
VTPEQEYARLIRYKPDEYCRACGSDGLKLRHATRFGGVGMGYLGEVLMIDCKKCGAAWERLPLQNVEEA